MIKKTKNFLYTYRRELLIFILLFLTLLTQFPDELHGWNSAWYAMDYSLGIDSRLFIGSLLHIFYPDFLPAEAAYTFVFLSLILLLLMLSYVLGFALRQAEMMKASPLFAKTPFPQYTQAGKGLTLLIAFYLLCPGSPSYLWTAENMGRFDAFLLLVTLAAVICCFHISAFWPQLLLITLAGLAALSIHQAFLFLFFPLLFTLSLKAATGKKASKIHLISTFASIAVIGAVFLYFQFFSRIRISSCDELVTLLSSRTDLTISEVALNYEYFSTVSQSSSDLVLNLLGERIRYGLITLFLLSPLAVLYIYLWLHILKTAPKKEKWIYTLLLLSHLCFVPAFVLTIDWGRWFGAFLTMQALQIVILAAKKDVPVLSALHTLEGAFRKHPYLFIAAGIWLGSLHKFQATLLPDAPVFFTSLYKLYRLFIF